MACTASSCCETSCCDAQVQENCIDLVGRIADRGAEYVPAREWMRICFELLEMLKAHKKGIRRATVNTFGYIAKAIGPQDVLVTLLNNLKVQERQNRVCTTVAIAIVAETCSPFTVLPALMNEYKVSLLTDMLFLARHSMPGRGRLLSAQLRGHCSLTSLLTLTVLPSPLLKSSVDLRDKVPICMPFWPSRQQ